MANTTDPPTAWTLEFSLSSEEEEVQQVTLLDAASSSHTFRNLEAGTEYRVRVAGENTRGTGTFSDSAVGTTNGSKSPH